MPKASKATPPAAGHSARRNRTSPRSKKISEAQAREQRSKRLQALIKDYEAEYGLIADSELAELGSR